MAQSNPGRDIAIILTASAVFGGALLAYLLPRTIGSKPEPPRLVVSSAASQVDARSEDARRVSSAFVQQLAMAHHEEAYRLMAAAYRQATSFSAFQAACMGSPFLSTARDFSLSKTSETIAPGASKGAVSATGVMTTGSGSVEAKFSFVDDANGLGIVQVVIAGSPMFLMGAVAPAKSAPIKPAKKL